MAGKSDDHRIELLKSSDHSEYLLRDPLEIASVLNGLIQQRTMLSAHPGGGQAFMLTSLLAADFQTGTLLFDVGSDDALNRAMSQASTVTFSALLDRIKVQFATGPLELAEHQGYAAFRAPLPGELLRLQRREYFRLITPVAHSVTCNIPVNTGEGGVRTHIARVVDISGGGVAVLVPPRELSLDTNMEFHDCSLLLPEFGDISAELRIRNIFQVTNRNGIAMTRAGCQFLNLPPGAENTIQRYILKIERERSAGARRR